MNRWLAFPMLAILTAYPLAASPPTIVTVKPQPDAVDSPIHATDLVEIRFDQPMAKSSVESAITMTPYNYPFAWKLNGAFRWKDDRTLAFVLPGDHSVRNALPAGTEFTVQVSAAATNLAGEPLQPYMWRFRTANRVVNANQVRQRFVAGYEQLFDLDVASPAFREDFGNSSFPTHSWTSTAYVGSEVYRLYLLDDGKVLSLHRPARRPAGDYRVAFVAIDHGNTDIASLMNTALVAAQDDINRKHEEFARSRGYGPSLLTFINTNFLVSSSEIADPTDRNQIIALVEQRGHPRSNFDVFVAFDMDLQHPNGGFASRDFIYMSYFYSPGDPELTLQLPALLFAVYDHEFGHVFGWEHDWSSSWTSNPQAFITDPALFGWTDTDGDGIPEILDSTPYAPVGQCVRDAETACLQGGRFEVKVAWQSGGGSGSAGVMAFGGQRTENRESAFYYFQVPTNFEIGVKVLDACDPALGSKHWVFISGLTNQGWTVTVRDTQTGAVKTYSNSVGHLSTTFADTSAFDCP